MMKWETKQSTSLAPWNKTIFQETNLLSSPHTVAVQHQTPHLTPSRCLQSVSWSSMTRVASPSNERQKANDGWCQRLFSLRCGDWRSRSHRARLLAGNTDRPQTTDHILSRDFCFFVFSLLAKTYRKRQGKRWSMVTKWGNELQQHHLKKEEIEKGEVMRWRGKPIVLIFLAREC